MHQALYRKWRPRIFDDVCGQEHITSVLRYEVEKGAPNHAYLFCGSRGTGKTTCAKILAKAVNCEAPVKGSPCGKCAACLAIENGSTTDVLEMDAASNNGVENIRDIRDEVVYTPSQLKYRVYIVDEVHMLSSSAFNALLKTLEEPPAHVIFILATTELQKLPATIISRCQRFDFRRIATPVLAARISYIAKEEQIDILPEAAERIARMAQGGMRDAISLLELCAGAHRTIDVATVNEMMGSGGREEMISLVRAVNGGDFEKIFSVIAEAVNASRDLTVFWQDLISLYRDLLVVKTTEKAANYLDLTDSETESLRELAAPMGKATLLAHCKLLEDALFAMQKANSVKRMVAELTLIRMCDPALNTSPEGLLSRVEKLESKVASGLIAAPAAAVAPSPQKEEKSDPYPPVTAEIKKEQPKIQPVAETKTPAAHTNGERVLHRVRGFLNCVERVRHGNEMAASFLTDAQCFTDRENRVILRLPSSFAQMMLEEGDSRDLLRGALSAELGREIRDRDLIFEIPTATEQNDLFDDLLEETEKEENKTEKENIQ